MIDLATRSIVITRAGNRCEYCQLPQGGYEATFNVDHIIAIQHGRDDDSSNLALSCPRCNRKKGPNLASLDPLSKSLVPLFNPRTDEWSKHFRWNGPLIVAITPVGRAMIGLLDLNSEERVGLRQALIDEGVFPH